MMECLLLALSGHAARCAECPLSGVSGHDDCAAKCPLMTQSGHRAVSYRTFFKPLRCVVLSLGGGNETARVHHTSLQRGSVAARRPRGAARAYAPHRRDPARSRKRCRISDLGRGIPASAGTIGLDHRPQHAHRHPLGHGQSRRNSQTSGGIGRARTGRHPGFWHRDRRAAAAGDPHRADRVPNRRRSDRCRLRRKPGAAGRQCHRFPHVRIQSGRENGWSCSSRSRRA